MEKIDIEAIKADIVAQPNTPRDQIDELVDELFEAHPDWEWLSALRRSTHA